MYNKLERYASYKRATIYFILYSVYFYISQSVDFVSLKTVFYFFVGSALSGAISALFMPLQYMIEKKLNPNYHICNIIIEVIGYYLFVKIVFSIFY